MTSTGMTSAELAAASKTTDAVVLELRDDVALVRLNQPDSRNALSADIKAHLETMIPLLMNDDAIRSVVITGTAESFCAGGDISNMADRKAPVVRTRMRRTHAWSKCILVGNKLVVAAVNGAAAGAGFSLALLCDIMLVSDKAFFRAAFSGLGAVPDLGLALTLPRAIGVSRAREMLLTNRRVEAAEAVTIGMATRMVPATALLDEAIALGHALAAGPATALGLTKMLINNAYEPVENFHETEAIAQAVAFGSDEFAEGVAAFLGKRKPQFRKTR